MFHAAKMFIEACASSEQLKIQRNFSGALA
jgi:hypothetical protein